MIFDSIISRHPIDKGWSGDKKYRAVTSDGSVYLLRISDASRYERKNREYMQMQQVAQLKIPMCLPVAFGECDEGVYSIQSWVDGFDAESVIPTMAPQKQYSYGLDAGKILKKIHTIPAPVGIEDWSIRFNRKIDKKLAMYQACPLKYANDTCILQYLQDNRRLLNGRPQSYQHGDYHIGNMMIDQSGVLTIIDFDRDDYGDPWEEFNRIVWCAQAAPVFATGMVDGYFEGTVPLDYWKLLALYICSNTLSSLPWAIPFGEGEIQTMRKQANEILCWYSNMQQVVPSWYCKMR